MNEPNPKPRPRGRLLVVAAAREAVSAVVPEELQFFEDVTEAWARGELPYQRGSRRMTSGTIGVGVDVTLVTELIYAVISGAAVEVLGAVATDAWRRRRWWRRGWRRAEGAATSHHHEITLTGGDAERLRVACRRHGMALGLSEDQADLLADAVDGAVRLPDKSS